MEKAKMVGLEEMGRRGKAAAEAGVAGAAAEAGEAAVAKEIHSREENKAGKTWRYSRSPLIMFDSHKG